MLRRKSFIKYIVKFELSFNGVSQVMHDAMHKNLSVFPGSFLPAEHVEKRNDTENK